jgi:K+:H+ antiporter
MAARAGSPHIGRFAFGRSGGRRVRSAVLAVRRGGVCRQSSRVGSSNVFFEIIADSHFTAHPMSSAVENLQSSVHQTENLLFFTLLQLALIIVAARLAGAVAGRVGQSRAVGEIVAGILLGPSLFGLLAPDVFAYVFRSVSSLPMTIMSQVGLILLMFQIGLEFDFSHLAQTRNRTAVLSVAMVGFVFPFVLGAGFGYVSAPYLLPGANQLGYALFCATAFSITAVPILGRIMMEFGITRTPIGVIAISAAGINDVIGWLMLALVTALTLSNFSYGDMALKLVALLAYVALCLKLVRPGLRWIIARSGVGSDHLPGDLLAVILATVFLSGIATFKIGVFAIFGGFMIGILLYDQKALVAAWKGKIEEFVTVFFLPVFFTYTGLRTNIGALDSPELWGWFALLLFLATLGKFGGCYWAARRSGMPHNESKLIGVMMNTRALMELVVINVGYDLGVIPSSVFTMLVLMALLSTVITAPCLRAWLPKVGLAGTVGLQPESQARPS